MQIQMKIQMQMKIHIQTQIRTQNLLKHLEFNMLLVKQGLLDFAICLHADVRICANLLQTDMRMQT